MEEEADEEVVADGGGRDGKAACAGMETIALTVKPIKGVSG